MTGRAQSYTGPRGKLRTWESYCTAEGEGCVRCLSGPREGAVRVRVGSLPLAVTRVNSIRTRLTIHPLTLTFDHSENRKSKLNFEIEIFENREGVTVRPLRGPTSLTGASGRASHLGELLHGGGRGLREEHGELLHGRHLRVGQHVVIGRHHGRRVDGDIDPPCRRQLQPGGSKARGGELNTLVVVVRVVRVVRDGVVVPALMIAINLARQKSRWCSNRWKQPGYARTGPVVYSLSPSAIGACYGYIPIGSGCTILHGVHAVVFHSVHSVGPKGSQGRFFSPDGGGCRPPSPPTPRRCPTGGTGGARAPACRATCSTW
eukprot:1182725-Prorocentrum_minimum.AAC.2